MKKGWYPRPGKMSTAGASLASGYCCYIAINTALSECCWYDGCPDGTWTTDISGTGYSCAALAFLDGDSTGSSTGWLTTSWPIQPEEVFSLTFHVHDTGDGAFDSEVILDNFRWHSDPTTPGTEPAGDQVATVTSAAVGVPRPNTPFIDRNHWTRLK